MAPPLQAAEACPSQSTGMTPSGPAVETNPGVGHPLLRDVQDQIKCQLREAKARLEAQLRETTNELQSTQRAREAAGEELHAQQLELERLDRRLRDGTKQQEHVDADVQAVEADISALERAAAHDAALTRTKQERVDALQRQLAAANSMLRLEAGAEEVEMGELAATKRAAYAADERAGRAARQREGRDALAERLQDELQRLQAKAAQHEAQRLRSCADADATANDGAELVAASAEVEEDIKSLVRRWNDALRTLRGRDDDLARAQEAATRQQEQRAALEASISRDHNDMQAHSAQNEERGAAVRRLGSQAERLTAQAAAAEQRGAVSAATAQEAQLLAAALSEELQAAAAEGKATERDRADLDRQRDLVSQDVQRLEEQNLEQLSEKLGADQSARRVAEDIRRAAAAAQAKAGALAAARLRLDEEMQGGEAAECHNAVLAAELQRAEDLLAARSSEVDAANQAMRSVQRDIERATRQAQAADRERLRRAAGRQDEDAGPLENTAANLQRDVGWKQSRAQELRQRWAELQRQLLAEHETHAAATAAGAEAQARMEESRREQRHLEQLLAQLQEESNVLGKALEQLRVETVHLGAELAAAKGSSVQLQGNDAAEEAEAAARLQDLQAECAEWRRKVQDLLERRQAAVSAAAEALHELQAWRHRLARHAEVRAALDPVRGAQGAAQAALSAEVAALQRQLEQAELLKERAAAALRRAVDARGVVVERAEGMQSRAAELAAGRQKRAVQDLLRSVHSALGDAAAAARRAADVEQQVQALLARQAAVDKAVGEEVHRQQELQGGLAAAAEEKRELVQATSEQQRKADAYAKVATGKYELHVADPATLPAALNEASIKLATLATNMAGGAAAD